MIEKKVPFRYHVGEGMIEPFWDPSVSGLEHWKTVDNGAEGVKVSQYWCYVTYEWSKTDGNGTGVELTRYYGELCVEGYDSLVLCAVVPENGFLRLSAVTDRGEITVREDGRGKKELLLPLDGAETVERITIAVGNTTQAPATGWINWLGAQNDSLLAEQQKWKRQFDQRWEGYLRDEDYEPSFCPKYGIIASCEELEAMRDRYEKHLQQGGRDVFLENIKPWLDSRPEDMIDDYIRLADDFRFCRERGEQSYLAWGLAEKMVHYALLKKDKWVLRLAARYAMALMMSSHWLDGFIADYPPGIWEHSAFVPSAILADLAAVLDGAGELFTPKALKMVQKQMLEKGLGKVNSVVWRYDSIFQCNQLAWYSYGRISAYAVLSREFPRLIPYMELAKKDVEDSMALAIGADGAAEEGISYFLYQPGNSGAALFWYARALGRSFEECLPGELCRTGDYIDALSSTQAQKAFLPVCDYSEPKDIRGIAIMAYLMPESLWVNAYHKKKSEMGGLPNDLLSFLLDERIPETDNLPRAFVRLPESGYVSSVRRDGESVMKVFLPGNRKGAGHNHEDKGSFLVEFNGEEYFTDPGMVSYGDAQSRSLKMCDYHNMLLPTGTADNPHPLNPLPYSFSPEGEGDEKELHLFMDMTPSFDAYYHLWKRRLDSAHPCELTLTDEYSLKQGAGVVVLLHTWFPVEKEDGRLVITGSGSRCVITLPEGVLFEESLHTIRERELRQLKLHQKGCSGKICIKMHFEKDR